ncbi:MAG: glycoside hydrolase family 3 C-terminal domain-containing protein [Clostridiales bacterium]|nr:glycoside hydrolase family 3 C-terminal domain-containing protein [Clostridiales bacterium]
MSNGKVKKPLTKKKRIITMAVCGVAIAIAIAIMIVANYLINYYSLILHRFFVGDTIDADESHPVFAAADQAVRDAAAESMVLLENKNGYLPINEKKVNLFGWSSTEYGFLLTGGGSGGTSITNEKKYKIDPDDAFKQEGFTINKTLYKAYTDYSKFDADYRSGTSGTTGAFVAESLKNPGASFYTDKLMKQAKEFSNVAVAFISRWGAENVNMEGADELRNIDSYKNGTFLELTDEEIAMFDKLDKYGFNVIVVLNLCNNIELGFIKDYDSIKACIFAGIPGQTGAIAIPQIISGKVNPSGRMSDILPYDNQTNNPTYFNAAKSGNSVTYQEGIYFGYKWYETAAAVGFFDDVTNKYGTGYDAVVQYPYGYGLSYTTFKWETDFSGVPATLEANGKYEVKVTVTNTGSVPGKEVVQLYGHTAYKEGGIEKPERTMLDFGKTKLLAKNESDTVTLTFSTYDLASFNERDAYKGFVLEEGKVKLTVQPDSHTQTDADRFKAQTAEVASTIEYNEDPVTGKTVRNRFTGNDTSYADMPIDGKSVYTGDKKFEYLSRANKFANYTKLKQIGNPSNSDAVKKASEYRHKDYDNADVRGIKYGQGMTMYLTTKKSGQRASMENLTGEETTDLVFDDGIMEALGDYDDETTWDLFLNQLTQNEIKRLIGQGGFTTSAVYSVGKPRATDKDGPAGFNNNVSSPGKSSVYTLYPSESLLGCSFSKDVAYRIGEAQGKIGSEFGIQGWYGPGVNLHRTPFTSRNYEYFSEDPVLSGILAAHMIKGAKDNHVYCYLKHFAVSEAGINPKDVNTWLTEQALREAYLRPFEIAVKSGDANAIMSAFNRVGAVLAGYNKAMLTDVLRTEWGFRGSVITDWYTGSGYMNSHELGVLAGNDLWLCGSTAKDANIDLKDKAIAYAARQSAKNILYTYIDTNIGNDSIKVNAEAKSGVVIFIWTMLNVVLALAILTCVWFILISIPAIRRRIPFLAKKDARRKEALAAAHGETVNADVAESEATEAVETQATEAEPAEAVEPTEAEDVEAQTTEAEEPKTEE